MNKIFKKIAIHSSVHFSGTLYVNIIGFFLQVYLANELGAKYLGYYSFGIAINMLLHVLATGGVGNAMIKYIPVYLTSENKVRLEFIKHFCLKRFFSYSTVLALILYLCGDKLANNLLGDAEFGQYVFIFSIILIQQGLLAFCIQLCRGLQEIKWSTIITTYIQFTSKILLAVIFLSLGYGFWGYLCAELISGTIGTIIYFGFLYNRNYFSFSLSKLFVAKISEEEKDYSLTLFWSNVFDQLIQNGDKILLGILMNPIALGIYAILKSLTNILPLPQRSFNTIFLPIISELFILKDIYGINSAYKKLAHYSLVLSLPLALIYITVPGTVLGLFGPEFQDGKSTLIVITASLLLTISGGTSSSLFLMMGKEKITLLISLIQLIVILLLYIILIPLYGIFGAGLAFFISQTISLVISLFWVRKVDIVIPYSLIHIKLIVSSFLVVFLVFFIGSLKLEIVTSLALSFVTGYVFFLSIYFFYILSRPERNLVSDLIKNKLLVTKN